MREETVSRTSFRRLAFGGLIILAGAAFALSPLGGGTPSTYLGPDGGVWNSGANWSGGVPNGDFHAIINDSGSDVTVNLDMTALLHTLTVDAGDTLNISNGRELRMHGYVDGVSEIFNSGTILLGSTVNNTYLRFDPLTDGDIFTLSGGGEIVANGGFNWMDEVFGNARLINADNTIRGFGLNVGGNSLEFDNQSLVMANGGLLDFDAPDGFFSFRNTGTYRADGGTLRLLSGGYDNTGGVIEAHDSSVVQLWSGASIQGGTLRTFDTGEIHAANGASHFDLDPSIPITNEGVLHVVNGNELRTFDTGTINNTGTIILGSTGSNTWFRFDPEDDGDVVTLIGGGEIFANGNFNWMTEVFGNARLINADNLIHGSGLNIGNNELEFENQALVVADTGLIDFDAPDGFFSFRNTGTYRADGGTLRLLSGGYDNTGGVIEAHDSSVVQLWSGASIQGGTLRTFDTAEIQAANGASHFDLDPSIPITNEGVLRIVNGNELRTFDTGTINNTGTIILGSTGSNTYFRFDPEDDGDVITLSGGGEIVANGGFNWMDEIFGNAKLVNADNTIRGGGLNIGGNSMDFENHGTVLADLDATGITIDPPDVGFGFENHGTLMVTGLGGMVIQGGVFSTDGDVVINAGRELERNNGAYRQVGGTTVVNGLLDVNNGNLNLEAGTLKGTGTVETSMTSTAGTVAPGQSEGTLSIVGSYTQQTGATLAIEVGGALPGEFDVLAVTGAANLAGTLEVSLTNAFIPTNGQQLVIMTAADVNGQFEFVVRGNDCGYAFNVAYTDTEVILTAFEESVLTNVAATRGVILSGGLADLIVSDDQVVRTRSGFGNTLIDLHSLRVVIDAVTNVSNVQTILLVVESRIDQPSGIAKLRLYDWNAGAFEQVHQYAVGTTEGVVVRQVSNAGQYVDGSGNIRLQIQHDVFVPFLAFTFQSYFDQVSICPAP